MEEKLIKILEKHFKNLQKLEKPNAYQVGGTYYGSTQLFSTRGNMLELKKNSSHRSYEYCSYTDYTNAYFIKIGGAYNVSLSEIKKELVEALGAEFDTNTRIGIIYDYGTNFSTIGFGYKA